MYKDMSDADLQEAINNLRRSINNAFGTKSGKNMSWMLRQLDIAVAVKRKRAQS